MNNKMKMPKTFFNEDYPLFEKVGKANFTIKLKHANKLRFTPEQFGRGLDKNVKELFRTTEHHLLASLQMQELQEMSKEDRLVHADWVLKKLDTYLRNRIDFEIDLLAELYND